MNSNEIKTQNSHGSPLLCRICGDVARGMNFDVLTCMACKAFFRRNALRPIGSLRCINTSNCEITMGTRTKCPDCRLKKCFTVGMKPQLIRTPAWYRSARPDFQQPITHSSQIVGFSTQQRISLLKNHHTRFVAEPWHILSNFMNGYDDFDMKNNAMYSYDPESYVSGAPPFQYN